MTNTKSRTGVWLAVKVLAALQVAILLAGILPHAPRQLATAYEAVVDRVEEWKSERRMAVAARVTASDLVCVLSVKEQSVRAGDRMELQVQITNKSAFDAEFFLPYGDLDWFGSAEYLVRADTDSEWRSLDILPHCGTCVIPESVADFAVAPPGGTFDPMAKKVRLPYGAPMEPGEYVVCFRYSTDGSQRVDELRRFSDFERTYQRVPRVTVRSNEIRIKVLPNQTSSERQARTGGFPEYRFPSPHLGQLD